MVKKNSKNLKASAIRHWQTSNANFFRICDSDLVHGQITVKKGEGIPEKIMISIKKGEKE